MTLDHLLDRLICALSGHLALSTGPACLACGKTLGRRA